MATEQLVFEARRLVRGAASATLATQRDGQPFASLVTPAAAPDLSILLWLSSLSEHTRQLQAEPRCALLFTGEAEGPNPQTAPRITLTGLAAPVAAPEAEALKARWLARHPYAALYAGFADFALWRVVPGGALLVGGFARATRLRGSELVPPAAALGAIAAAEADIVAHMNADHPDAVAAIAQGLLGGPPGPWRMAAVDVDGGDLVLDQEEAGQARRLAFSAPADSVAAVRHELIAAAQRGRKQLADR